MVSIFTKACWLQQDAERLNGKVRYALKHPEAGTPCVGRFGAVPYNDENRLELERQRASNVDEQRRLDLRRALYQATSLSPY